MRKDANLLKSLEEESKRYLNAESEGALGEFRKYVFEKIFLKGLGYDKEADVKLNNIEQVCIIKDKLKIKITFDEVDDRSEVNSLFRDHTNEGTKYSTVEWGMIISPKGIWLFNNNILTGKSVFQTNMTVLEIIYGKNSDQDYFEFLSYDNILGVEPNTYYFRDIAEYRNCYYKGSEKSWLSYSSALKRFLKYCSLDMKKRYLKNEIENVYDTIELPDFYSYIEKKTKSTKENTVKNAFFYIKDFMCCMSAKGNFDIGAGPMLEGFGKFLKKNERKDVIALDKSDKLKKAIQYLDTGKNKERDVAMFLMELSFGLERRKLRFLKWSENFYWNSDGSIKELFKYDKKEMRMPAVLIRALQRLKILGVRGDYVFYHTRDNGEEPIREDVINAVFSKLIKIDPNDEYYKFLSPANIRGSLVRHLLEQGEALERIIYLMNIEIWNLGSYISLKDIDWIIEQRNEKENHPMEKFLDELNVDFRLTGGKNNDTGRNQKG